MVADSQIIISQILYLFGIAAVAFLGGMIPFLFKRCSHAQRVMGIANACAGGIFLAVGLCHMLADGIEGLEPYQGEGKPLGEFPLALCLMGCGGVLILFVEKVLITEKQHALGHGHIEGADDHHHHHHHHNHDRPAADLQHPLLQPGGTLPGSSNPAESVNGDLAPKDGMTAPSLDEAHHQCQEVEEISVHEEHQHQHGTISLVSCLVLVIALGVHSFIEGLALGVINTPTEALLLFVAIVAHKWAETAALSIAFITAGIGWKKNLIIIGLFACITPLGILMGLFLVSVVSGDAALVTRGCLQSLAAGTFTYVSYMELIGESFEDGQDKWAKFGVLLVGFGAMAAFALLE
ncbi:putative metal cation transporter; ZIP family protein [Paratrimastix pyriformis]|uniref:Metal cation transporter n=1 Tax=Paratrimastix pyriformis TaxID=342808 RepID=A0ABQ8URQ6_9EUKA|nr:putative metal cation transporter; ZIP family protein [Paratrimastix pyriformis]